MQKPLKALIVDDSEDDAVLVVRELRRGGFDVFGERVENAAAVRAALAGRPWDVVISDYAMPHFSGIEALKIVQETGLDLPFILVSGVAGEEQGVEAMRLGARDYLMKKNLPRLAPAVERELRQAEMRRERKRADEEIRQLNQELQRKVTAGTEELAAKNEGGEYFTSSLAADLQEPLGQIQAYCKTLEGHLGSKINPSVQKSLQGIADASQRMSNVIEEQLGLLRTARQQVSSR